MDVLLVVCLALSTLLAANACASVMAAALWQLLRSPMRRWQPSTCARVIFWLRLSPLAVALVTATLFIPSYLAYEPRPADEVMNLKLCALASAAAFGLALTLRQGVASWRATHRLIADWVRQAERVRIEGLSIPAYRFPHPFPVMALVGVLRPRLFIADNVYDALDEDEIFAAIAHEVGHLAARDNLKRGLMRACSDTMAYLPINRAVERNWAAAAEAAADERAARAGVSVALDLASALIKIARLAPAGATPTMPAGACLIGDEVGAIEWRVRRLIEMAGSKDAAGASAINEHNSRWARGVCSTGTLVLVAVIATNPTLLFAVHLLAERLFSILR